MEGARDGVSYAVARYFDGAANVHVQSWSGGFEAGAEFASINSLCMGSLILMDTNALISMLMQSFVLILMF